MNERQASWQARTGARTTRQSQRKRGIAPTPELSERVVRPKPRNKKLEAANLATLMHWHDQSTDVGFMEGTADAGCSVASCPGLCQFGVSSASFEALNDLGRIIEAASSTRAPWNGCDDDARERCYGFSPPLARDTPSSAQGLERLSAAGVSFHMQEFTGEVAANDEARNRLASVQLTREVDHGREAGARAGDAEKEETGEKEPRRGGVWTEAAEAAVGEVVALVNALVEPKYRPYVTRDNLIALQPNSHNSAEHLTLHLDQPRYEGFGVVIVTVALEGAATIVVVDEGDEGESERAWRFRLEKGQGYVLSGDARNKCLHGVKADGSGRRSLNLRFGLHAPRGEMSAEQEVERHWPSGAAGY